MIVLQVFITGPETNGESPEKLERKERVKVFDFRKFYDQLQKYVAEGRLKNPEENFHANLTVLDLHGDGPGPKPAVEDLLWLFLK